MKNKTAICPICGKAFEQRKSNHIYCSQACGCKAYYEKHRVEDGRELRDSKYKGECPCTSCQMWTEKRTNRCIALTDTSSAMEGKCSFYKERKGKK